ncbi:MAG TPA: FG-GAP-like repeat-containing protein [Pyrinomonadaceae bacterium]
MLYKNSYRTLPAVSLFVALVLSAVIYATPGYPDPTFGGEGTVITTFDPNGWATDIAVQGDGKIVIAGFSQLSLTAFRTILARYNPDGSLDTSFGNSGRVITSFGFENRAYALALQADGRILVAGTAGTGASSDFMVLRFDSDGSLDTTFDFEGVKTIDFGSSEEGIGLAVQPDGRAVIVGKSPPDKFAVARLNLDGSLDGSFDGDGRVLTAFGLAGSGAGAVSLQPDGKIIAAGFKGGGAPGNMDSALVRYHSNGSLDTSFDGDGIVLTPVSSFDDFVADLAIQPDGKIVTSGGAVNDFALVRYNPNGSLDTSFDGDGIVVTTITLPCCIFLGNAFDVAIQSNGKIVAAGSVEAANSIDFFGAVARYESNGSPDSSFGTNGISIVGNTTDTSIYALALQPDGRILLAGYDAGQVIVARYIGDKRVTRFDFDGDGRSDISVFRPVDAVWYLNRSIQGFTAIAFGIPTDRTAPADFDGDGKTDITVFRDGVWWLLKSSDLSVSVLQFGIASDIPVPADYTGDGRAEIAVYRGGTWWTWDLATNHTSAREFGVTTDKPVPADYDGDGKADQAVYRNGEWHLNRSTQGYTVIQFGLAADTPVVGDYDGDGRSDPAVYRSGVWYLLQSSRGFLATQFGIASDTPVAADYDGDGKTDIAVFRNGTWYLLRSQSGFAVVPFGLANDQPVQAYLVP